MTHTHTAPNVDTTTTAGGQQANVLAERLEQGARALLTFASGLTDAEWQTRVPHDGRTVGVTVHHVGSMYPLEIQLALQIAAGNPVAGVSWDDVHAINAKHAAEHANVTKEAALEHVRTNSAAAAAAIRALTDEQLQKATTNSLYSDAPLTCQFFIEDHTMRHSYQHLARMRRAVGR
jgi:DinB superfamily